MHLGAIVLICTATNSFGRDLQNNAQYLPTSSRLMIRSQFPSKVIGAISASQSTERASSKDTLNQLRSLTMILFAQTPSAAFSISARRVPSFIGSSGGTGSVEPVDFEHRSRASNRFPTMNFLEDIMDAAADGGKLTAQKPPENPLLPSLVKDAPASYTLQEKLFSMSGEDFTVKDLAGEDVLKIDGGNVNLGGVVVDKLAFKNMAGEKFFSVERRIISASTCYDIYNPDGSVLLAKVEREWISMTPKYQFYYEGDDNPFGDFYAEGSFSDREYIFKAAGGFQTIAKVRRAPEVFRDVDGYAVDVAAGVDAAAIVAMAVIIDEDHDEEDAKKQKEEGGWFR